MTIRLVIPEPSPSLNKYAFRHWRVQHTDKKRWALMLHAVARKAKAEPATGKRRLTIERHGRRRLDVDNIIGGAKCCITDNLRKLGLLLDDDDKSIEFVAVNVKLEGDQKPHTVILLEDL
jgi:hypothetical protein